MSTGSPRSLRCGRGVMMEGAAALLVAGWVLHTIPDFLWAVIP